MAIDLGFNIVVGAGSVGILYTLSLWMPMDLARRVLTVSMLLLLILLQRA